jgi:hypothetical protein
VKIEMNYTYKVVDTYISFIQPGDVIELNGIHRTLCKKDFGGKGDLLGPTILGDSYHSGYAPVKLVSIFHATPEKCI